MWILTEDVNDYRQYGTYFRGAWKNKPTFEDLNVSVGNTVARSVIDKGSFEDYHSEWVLKEVKDGMY